MHSHGAKLSTVGIVIESISNLIATVAAVLAEPVNRGYLDYWFDIMVLQKRDSCNMTFFGVQ